MRHFTIGIYTLMTMLFMGLNSLGQTYEWTSAFQGSESVFGQDIVVDEGNNVINVGYFYGTADFDPGPGNFDLTSPDQQDIYITKLDANGDLLWAQNIGNNIERNRANNVAIDNNGNIYVTGYFEGTVDFDNGSGTGQLTSQNIVTAFLLKLDENGNFQWVRKYGGPDGVSEGLEVTLDNNGEVILTGYFTGTCEFDPINGGMSFTSSVARDAFLMKVTNAGSTVWARQLEGTDDNRSNTVAVDDNGNLVIGGFFKGQIDYNMLNPGTAIDTTSTGNDIFVAKYDNDGNYIWSKSIQGSGDNQLNRLAVNRFGNIFATGQFENTLDFDPGTGISDETAQGLESYVLSINEFGDFNWVNRIGGTGQDLGLGIAVDPNGDVYGTGYYNGTADFDGTTTMTSLGGNTVYVAKYDDNGTLIWNRRMGGNGNDFGFNVSVSSNWDVITTGYFLDNADFDPDGSSDIFNAIAANDAFVNKLSQTCTQPVLDSINYTAADTLFCPSEMASTQLVVIGDLNDAADWEWYTEGCGMTHVASGDTVTFMPTETTTYYVRAEGACGTPQTCDSITIHVDDFEAPVADLATLDDITEICEVTELTTPTATDNCEGTLQGTHDATLPITSNTTITWTYEDASGNMATQTQDVVLTGVDVSTTVNGIQLIANNDNVGVDYRWIDCNNNNEPIVDATNQSYTPEENGSYAVIVLEEGCQDTSDCIDVTTVGLENYAKTAMNVYPNPSAGEFTVELTSADAVSYTVTDNAGRIVLEGTFEQLANKIDLSTEEHGVYFLRVEESVVKLVVRN